MKTIDVVRCVGTAEPDVPEWQRTALIYGRLVFLPSTVTDLSESTVTFCAQFEGINWIQHAGHCFFESNWLGKVASLPTCIGHLSNEILTSYGKQQD